MRQPRPAARGRPATGHHFTLVELLLVVTVLLILVALLMPVLGRALGQARRVVCISNMRQLTTAWFGFQGDHGGDLVSAGDGGWVGGSNDREAITQYQLYPYTGDATIYRCPSDPWEHARTYSINGYLNEPSWPAFSDVPVATRFTDLKRPDSTFVFIEEYDDRGWCMSGFIVCTPWDPETWVDCPASFHFQGINLSFADGHLECWTWQDPRTLLLDGGHFLSTPLNPDLRRLAKASGTP